MASILGLGLLSQLTPCLGSLPSKTALLGLAAQRGVHYFVPKNPEAAWKESRAKWRQRRPRATFNKAKVPALTDDAAAWLAKFLEEETPLSAATRERFVSDANNGRVSQDLDTIKYRLGSLAAVAEKGEITGGKLDLTTALAFDRRALGVSAGQVKYRLRKFWEKLPEELRTSDIVSMSLGKAARNNIFAAYNVLKLEDLLKPLGLSLASARATNLRVLQHRAEDIEKRLAHLQTVFKPQQLQRILQCQLNIITHSSSAVDGKLDNLATQLQLGSRQKAAALVAKVPQLLTLHPSSVQEKIESLARQTQLPMEQVQSIFRAFPHLLTRSLDSVVARYHTLSESVRENGPEDLTPQQLLTTNPKALVLSLEQLKKKSTIEWLLKPKEETKRKQTTETQSKEGERGEDPKSVPGKDEAGLSAGESATTGGAAAPADVKTA